MTFPSLIAQYQKKQNAVQLKAAYSIISQAFKSAEAEHGDTRYWFPNMHMQTSGRDNYINEYVDKYFKPYVKVIQDYGMTSFAGLNKTYLYELNGAKNLDYYASQKRILVLQNGTLLAFGITGNCYQDTEGNCISDWWYTGFSILVDVNGLKAPNTFGKDIFEMRYTVYDNDYEYQLIFQGTGNTTNQLKTNCSKSGTGIQCGALIQRDNWEIKYDW